MLGVIGDESDRVLSKDNFSIIRVSQSCHLLRSDRFTETAVA